MDILLFADQLNWYLSNADPSAWPGEMAALLSMHAQAGVKLSDAVHLMPPTDDGEYEYTYQDIQLYSLQKPPDANTQLAVYMVAAAYTVIKQSVRLQASVEHKRKQDAAKGVINALSFSELEAAVHICQALPTSEGLLVAGHVADRLGFTRSVVVNALRKLESAGVVETRSLGMKGTYIKFKDALFKDELDKLK